LRVEAAYAYSTRRHVSGLDGRGSRSGRVTTGDASWNAFLKQYGDNSEIKAQYFTCMPTRARKGSP
jgi:hypothetical protein